MTIDDINKIDCCGCSLCANLCGKKCITMQFDEEGFLFPVINKEHCTDCGLCYKKCPVNKANKVDKIDPIYYASAISDKEDLLNSSSGGTFIALAKYILSEDGYVCGCVFDENMMAKHICTNSLNDVKRMMGSKYVQSTIESVLPEVKQLVINGHKVMFTGTACQIAAVKGLLRNVGNIYFVDILCHGVPSPLLFKKYVDFLEKKHNGKVVNLEFRNKKELGWGSEHRTYYEIAKNGKNKGYRPVLPAYFCSFFYGTNLRESCYNCKFAGPNRISDITIGDFWGYWAYYKKKFPEGVSIASLNSEKGKRLFEAIKSKMAFCDELPADKGKGTNTNFYHPTIRPQSRNGFYEGLKEKQYKNFIWKIYKDKYTRKNFIISIYGRFVPTWIKNIKTKIEK